MSVTVCCLVIKNVYIEINVVYFILQKSHILKCFNTVKSNFKSIYYISMSKDLNLILFHTT